MLTDDTEICPATGRATAAVYQTTEEARLLLADAADDELVEAGRAASEAAYYLSDTIEADERIGLLGKAEARLREDERQHRDGDGRVAEAFSLLSDAAGEVEELLRGPNASSELRIGLRALQRAIAGLAGHTGPAANHPDPNGRHSQGLTALRRTRSRRHSTGRR
jgi:hypothetical protein